MDALLPNFVEGDRAAGLGLDGTETVDCAGLDKGGTALTIIAKKSRCLGTDLPNLRADQHTGRMGRQPCPVPAARTGTGELTVPDLNGAHGLRELTVLAPTGPNEIAQGNALGSMVKKTPALQGRNEGRSHQ